MDFVEAEYNVRYFHKIAPNDKDVGKIVLKPGDFSDSKRLAKALRDGGILQSGARFREMRVEADKVVCFPDRGIWHSIVITVPSVV